MGQLNLRVPDDTKVRWADAAVQADVRLSEFVRVAVDEKIAGAESAIALPYKRSAPRYESGPAVPPATTKHVPPSGPGAAAESGASGRAST